MFVCISCVLSVSILEGDQRGENAKFLNDLRFWQTLSSSLSSLHKKLLRTKSSSSWIARIGQLKKSCTQNNFAMHIFIEK